MVGCEPDTKKNGLGSTQTAEIDIVETFFKNPRKYEPKLHPWSDPDLEEFYERDVMLPGTDDDYYDEFHTYGVNWTPESLVFYVDGVEVSRTEQSPQYEMCIFLSIMASFDPDSWGGGACDGQFPYTFEVDYVRVYKNINGYPNGITKPTEYEYSGYPMIQSEVYTGGGDPAIDLGIDDLARNATLTTTGQHVNSLGLINEAGYKAYSAVVSADNPTLPVEYTFTWNSPQDVNMLNLYSYVANGQAPTVIKLEVQKEGGEWTAAGEYEIEWQLLTSTPEYAKLPISGGVGITALKVIVEDANLMWQHYVIQKIHIYDDSSTNRMYKATATTNAADMQSLANVIDGDVNTGNWRPGAATDIDGKDYIQFNWANPIAVNKLIMTVTKARNCAPTAWRIQVSKDGESNWTDVASVSGIVWTQAGDVKETSELTFALQNIKGLRVYIDGANLAWGGYAIQEFEAYNDPTLYGGNYALTSHVTTNTGADTSYLNNGNYEGDTWRSGAVNGDYYQFNWDNAISINKVAMVTSKSHYTLPTAWSVQVSTDGETGWTEVASASGLSSYEYGDVKETSELIFAHQENIKGVRVCIDAAPTNTSWNGYGIREIEMYQDVETNYVPTSNVTTNTTTSRLTNVVDGDSNTDAWRSGAPYRDYYQFNWASPISASKVAMIVNNARNCAPKAWSVQVSTDGETGWTEVGSVSDVPWAHLQGVQETSELTFTLQENIKGIRVYIDANPELTNWNGYGIREIEIYPGTSVNHALTSTVTSNTGSSNLTNLVNGAYDADCWRSLPNWDYYQFNWDSAISTNKVIMSVQQAKNCAPTAWRVQVSADGQTGWTDVASVSDIPWTQLGKVVETSALTFTRQENIKGVRVYVEAANNAWDGYSICEIEICNDLKTAR